MNVFFTSDGVLIVERDTYLTLRLANSESLLIGSGPVGTALKEYVRHVRETAHAQADERFGRWRWPEDAEHVVYADDLGCLVLLEGSGYTEYVSRSHPEGDNSARRAARAYFAAHPVEAKPWQEARPGEGWVLDIGTEEYPNVQAVVVSNKGRFLFRDGGSIPVDQGYIRSGRRVHPEVSE